MFTSAGVRLICFSKFKVALVPKQLGKLKFNTGNEWEQFCFKSTRIINFGLGIISILYPLVLDGTLVLWINKLSVLIQQLGR